MAEDIARTKMIFVYVTDYHKFITPHWYLVTSLYKRIMLTHISELPNGLL